MSAPWTNPPTAARSRPRSLVGCLALALLAESGLGAAELVLRDFNFSLESLPSSFSYSLSDSNGRRSGSDSFDSAYGLAVGAAYSFAGPGDSRGFLLGAKITASQASYASIGHLTNYGLRVEGGYGYAFSDRWAFTAMAKIGYGLATLDITANSAFPALSASGSALSYGASLGAGFALSNTVLLTLDVGYLKIANKLSGQGITATIDSSGLAVGLGLTYRFWNSPRPLE